MRISDWSSDVCSSDLSLDIFESDDVITRNRDTAAKMAKLAAPFASHPLVTDVRQAGMIVAIELRPEPGGTEDGNAVESANRRGPAMYRTARARGVPLRLQGDVLYGMPPCCLADETHALLADPPGPASQAAP